jgi:hypothetical protein
MSITGGWYETLPVDLVKNEAGLDLKGRNQKGEVGGGGNHAPSRMPWR